MENVWLASALWLGLALLASIMLRFEAKEGMYTTPLMSTGLTFGTISALFGLSNKIIDQQQYTILVTAVIGSAVIPTLIAQAWFQPAKKPMEEEIPNISAPESEHAWQNPHRQ